MGPAQDGLSRCGLGGAEGLGLGASWPGGPASSEFSC